jgi:predicted MPP superfamily phosphohydrolase
LLLAAACAPTPRPPTPDPIPLPPARGDVRIVVISDLNSSYGSTEYEPPVHRAVALIRETWRPDLVLAAGDLVAGQRPALSDDVVRAMWAAFDAAVGRPLREAGIPFGFTLGNHDGSAYPAHARDRTFAVAHWRDPAHATSLPFVDSAHFPVHYSFERDGVFVLVWDASYAGAVEDTAMLRWAEAQLSAPRARQARFRLVLGHLPLHAVAEGRDRPGEVLQQPDSLRALLERHQVDLYVSGHHHAHYPGRRGGLALLHAGALGQGARPLLGDTTAAPQSVTVLDFHAHADSIAWTTYTISPDGQRVERLDESALPPRLRGHNGHVVRRDLSDAGGEP